MTVHTPCAYEAATNASLTPVHAHSSQFVAGTDLLSAVLVKESI